MKLAPVKDLHDMTSYKLFSHSGPGFTKGLKQKIVITLREKS